MTYQLVLASQSPRRREILESAGLRFSVRASGVPEQQTPGESPRDYVQRLARTKAEAVNPLPGELVLGADTVVVLDQHILEKPADAADAARMLRMLSGRDHRVLTGICLLSGSRSLTDCAETLVRFATLTEEEITSYAATAEPFDKAGAYGIQGLASKFIVRIEGCYFNVVGLPIALVWQHLKSFGQETA